MSRKTYSAGIGFPSYCFSATWAAYSGYSSDSNYPVANLGDKRAIRKVASFTTGSGPFGWAVTAVLPAAQALQFFSLVEHTLTTLATFRICLFSDTNPDPVGNPSHMLYDTGYLAVWPKNTAPLVYPAVRPFLLTHAIVARSVYLEIKTNDTVNATYDIGAFEISGWWDWSKMDDGRSLGTNSRAGSYAVSGNVDMMTVVWNPRTFNGVRHTIDIDKELDTTCVDFQQQQGIWNPFVYIDDIYDPISWPRLAFLARNSTLPMSNTDSIVNGTFTIDIIEHLG